MKVMIALSLIALAGSSEPFQSSKFNAATDLIVDGKVETLAYEPLGEDIVLDGVITARLTVARVVRGRPPASRLTIKYIAHMGYPTGQVRRYHLRRLEDGSWLSCTSGKAPGYVCR